MAGLPGACVPTLSSMGQRLLQRRLSQTSARIKEIRSELRVVEDQLSHFADEAAELSLRALVSETPGAEFEYRDAKRHADVMEKRRDGLRAELAEAEARINDLLDKMKEPST